jgi:hypothetical protein
MSSPVFKNAQFESVLIYATPQGMSVTIHPGEYVIGEYFRKDIKEGYLVEITDAIEISKILPRLIKYHQKG